MLKKSHHRYHNFPYTCPNGMAAKSITTHGKQKKYNKKEIYQDFKVNLVSYIFYFINGKLGNSTK